MSETNTIIPQSSCELIEESGLIALKNVRLVFSHIHAPYSADPEKKKKFSVTVTFPKSHKETFRVLFWA